MLKAFLYKPWTEPCANSLDSLMTDFECIMQRYQARSWSHLRASNSPSCLFLQNYALLLLVKLLFSSLRLKTLVMKRWKVQLQNNASLSFLWILYSFIWLIFELEYYEKKPFNSSCTLNTILWILASVLKTLKSYQFFLQWWVTRLKCCYYFNMR